MSTELPRQLKATSFTVPAGQTAETVGRLLTIDANTLTIKILTTEVGTASLRFYDFGSALTTNDVSLGALIVGVNVFVISGSSTYIGTFAALRVANAGAVPATVGYLIIAR